jgi:hypothetical protein
MQCGLTVDVGDDEDGIRHDIRSDDMRRVHPDLPSHGTPTERDFHLLKCDLRAYSTVRRRFPLLTPPSHRLAPERQDNSPPPAR